MTILPRKFSPIFLPRAKGRPGKVIETLKVNGSVMSRHFDSTENAELRAKIEEAKGRLPMSECGEDSDS